jgi:hypothetical protein
MVLSGGPLCGFEYRVQHPNIEENYARAIIPQQIRFVTANSDRTTAHNNRQAA